MFAKKIEEPAIIANEDILLPDFMPDEILHRNSEMEEVADAIRPLTQNRFCDNLFIYGPSGTGKTTCIKILLKQLEESSTRVIPVYVNCWEYPTQMGVYSRIVHELEEPLPRRGLATDEVFSRVLNRMKQEKVSILVILDEIDAILFKGEQELLYTLSRANEKQGIKFGIIGVSNKPSLLSRLDDRISTSLRFTQMQFKPYSTQQIVEILETRAHEALVNGTYGKEVLEACAVHASQNGGNVRLALELLWKSAKNAEKKLAKRIETSDITEVMKKTCYDKNPKSGAGQVNFDASGLNITEDEQVLVEILKAGEKTSTEVYDEFLTKKKKTKRQIRNYLKLLEAKGLIEMEEKEREEPSMLKTKIIKLKEK